MPSSTRCVLRLFPREARCSLGLFPFAAQRWFARFEGRSFVAAVAFVTRAVRGGVVIVGVTDRIQLNINARRVEFSDYEVLGVYRRALDLGPDIILQHQELTAPVIERFLRELGPKDAPRVHVLLDESRGKGLAPASWSIPTQYAGLPVYVGFAGGIGPANTQDVLNQVRALMRPYWIDMETSVRTDNAFDVAKVEAVLRAAEPFVAR